jgi:hypothetical protein
MSNLAAININEQNACAGGPGSECVVLETMGRVGIAFEFTIPFDRALDQNVIRSEPYSFCETLLDPIRVDCLSYL